VLELDFSLPFDAAADADFFSALPLGSAVCLVEMQNPQAEPLLIRTQNLRRRIQRLLGPPDPTSKRLNLRELARVLQFRAVGSTFEQTVTYYQHAKRLFPQRYRDLLRLRPPAVLKVSLRNAYPRCYVTRHISVDSSGAPSAGTYYGPFPSRGAALAFANGALDFFKIRRCQIKIRRDPSFPGCLYSEMRMCLAPCFAGCSKEEYDAEVQRFVKFLESSGESLRAAFESERERASDDLDFERAAALHKKVDKLEEVLRGRPDLARRIQALDALILQRGAGEQVVAAFRVQGGKLCEPFFLPFGEMAIQPRSAEQLFRNYLDPAGPATTAVDASQMRLGLDSAKGSPEATAAEEATSLSALSVAPSTLPSAKGELSEHLWLVARWFYSNPRAGEIFFREKNDWPYRRILRACARVLAPPAEVPPPAPSGPAH
jgi:excinuclease ABC subunit C